MVDHDGVGGQEEVGEALGDLRELQPGAVKDLQGTVGEYASQVKKLHACRILQSRIQAEGFL